MAGPARLASLLAAVMVIGGFGLIVLAWNGAAGYDTIQQQLPFALSGGLGGLGLVIAGAGVLLVQALRETGARQRRDLREAQAELAALLEGLAHRSPS